MSYGYGGYGYGFRPYVSQGERRATAARAMAKRVKSGKPVAPIPPMAGRKIATTFWGRAWCDNLERYGDFANRLPRGRTYVRNGSVVHLEVAPGKVSAFVNGSTLYEVEVKVTRMSAPRWKALCGDCVGEIDSLVELLRGSMDDGVMQRVCRPDDGLFPKPKELEFSCSCPDNADMCKHIAASLYGIGARLDAEPALLFLLRGVSAEELVAQAASAMTARPKAGPGAGRRLADREVADVFGVELAGASADQPDADLPAAADRAATTPTGRRKRAATKGPAAKAPAAKVPAKAPAKAPAKGPAKGPPPRAAASKSPAAASASDARRKARAPARPPTGPVAAPSRPGRRRRSP